MHRRIKIVLVIFLMYSLEFAETTTTMGPPVVPPVMTMAPVPETTIFEKFAYLNARCGPGEKECDDGGHLKCPEDEPRVCECEENTNVDRYDQRRCIHSEDNERKFGEECNNAEGEHCNLREQLQCSIPQGEGTCECIKDKYVKYNKTTKKCVLNETGRYGFGGGDTIDNHSIVYGIVQIFSCFLMGLLFSS